MPQFDTFTFLSQITWVFFLFSIVYLSISYSLSPITATILKVRKLKFLDIKKSSIIEASGTDSIQKNSVCDTLNGLQNKPLFVALFSSKFNVMEFFNFISTGFVIEGIFFRNKFRNILLRSIYSI